MPYTYTDEREKLFTDEGQKLFLKVRNRANYLLKEAGAFRLSEVLKGMKSGDSWQQIACVDRLVELGEVVELHRDGCWGQYRVFTSPQTNNL